MEKIRQATLLFLIKEDFESGKEICLAMKKRGFGMGRWNGVGGKVEKGESIEEAVKREAFEEIGVEIVAMKKMAELNFSFVFNSKWNQEVWVYFSSKWKGTPVESEEMNPRWFSTQKIPFEKMWPDDIFWLPQALKGSLIKGTFEFGKKDVLLKNEVEIVDKFNLLKNPLTG